MLWAACILHDIGVSIDYDDHHRHSHYLILNSGLPGWSPRELELIALVARWHRKGAPDASRLGDLERKGDGRRLRLLCGVIRLAEQLERSRDRSVASVSLEQRKSARCAWWPPPTARAPTPAWPSGPPSAARTCWPRRSARTSRSSLASG